MNEKTREPYTADQLIQQLHKANLYLDVAVAEADRWRAAVAVLKKRIYDLTGKWPT